MSAATQGGLSELLIVKTAVLSVSLAQTAGTYDMGAAAGGDVLVEAVTPYCSAAAAGLTSLTLVTNDGVPLTLLGATLLSALLSGAPLTPYTTRFLLASTKKIQCVIVGIGSGSGVLKAVVRYVALAQGATLA